jgi:hypothetical protein
MAILSLHGLLLLPSFRFLHPSIHLEKQALWDDFFIWTGLNFGFFSLLKRFSCGGAWVLQWFPQGRGRCRSARWAVPGRGESKADLFMWRRDEAADLAAGEACRA